MGYQRNNIRNVYMLAECWSNNVVNIASYES